MIEALLGIWHFESLKNRKEHWLGSLLLNPNLFPWTVATFGYFELQQFAVCSLWIEYATLKGSATSFLSLDFRQPFFNNLKPQTLRTKSISKHLKSVHTATPKYTHCYCLIKEYSLPVEKQGVRGGGRGAFFILFYLDIPTKPIFPDIWRKGRYQSGCEFPL